MREIDAETFLETMRQNTHFNHVDTPLGVCVEMDWVDAFCFAYCTDSTYFDCHIYPFSPGRGLLQVSNMALRFNLKGGNVFDGSSIKHSPLVWNQNGKEYLFQGTKYILPVQTNSQQELKRLRRGWIDDLDNEESFDSTDFVLLHIDSSKNGNGMEKFLEYITCYHYKEQGWVVDNQLTISHDIGTPDFTAFKDNRCEGGYFLIELMLEFAGHRIPQIHSNITRNIVGEAKTGTSAFETQLRKYLGTGFFDQGFGLLPQEKSLSTYDIGLVYIDRGGNLSVIASEINHSDENEQGAFFEWLHNLQRCYQLLNGDEQIVIEFVHGVS